MAYSTISYEAADRVATITLDRPDRMNAYTDSMRQEIIAAATDLDIEQVQEEQRLRLVATSGSPAAPAPVLPKS